MHYSQPLNSTWVVGSRVGCCAFPIYPCSVSLQCMLGVLEVPVSNHRGSSLFYFDVRRGVEMRLAPQWADIDCIFSQTSTLTPSMHCKLADHDCSFVYAKQPTPNQISTWHQNNNFLCFIVKIVDSLEPLRALDFYFENMMNIFTNMHITSRSPWKYPFILSDSYSYKGLTPWCIVPPYTGRMLVHYNRPLRLWPLRLMLGKCITKYQYDCQLEYFS